MILSVGEEHIRISEGVLVEPNTSLDFFVIAFFAYQKRMLISMKVIGN